MDDDWDAEDFVPPPPSIAKEQPKSQWDDEDAEEDNVKESWEDDDAPKEVDSAPAPAAQKPKIDKKKATESKGKGTVTDESANKLSEKLQQQRLVEEADYQSTTELFGKRAGDKTLDNFIPKSESDILEYAELVAHTIRPFEKSFHFLTLLKAVMRHAMTSLKAADAKEIASSVTIIANEKLKAEKEAAAGKKKTGPKKKQLHMDKPDDDNYGAPYDEVDEYDFM